MSIVCGHKLSQIKIFFLSTYGIYLEHSNIYPVYKNEDNHVSHILNEFWKLNARSFFCLSCFICQFTSLGKMSLQIQEN